MNKRKIVNEPISNIVVDGLSRYTKEKILKIIPFKVGTILTSTKIDKIIQELFETGYFSDISIVKSDNTLKIKVKENPIIESINIEGAYILTEDKLLRLLDYKNLNPYNDKLLSEVTGLITNTYFDLGYLDFKILEIQSDLNKSRNKISITIIISEGTQYTLRKISFSGGLDVIAEDKLRMLLSIKEGNIFNSSQIRIYIQTLTEEYANIGYAYIDITPITDEILEKINIDFEINSRYIYIYK